MGYRTSRNNSSGCMYRARVLSPQVADCLGPLILTLTRLDYESETPAPYGVEGFSVRGFRV